MTDHHCSATTDELLADPFGERVLLRLSSHKTILGGAFRFDSNSEALLDLVEAAYAGLPEHRFPVAGSTAEFRIELRLMIRKKDASMNEPPPVRMQSGAGVLCGVMDTDNYAILLPDQRRALIVVSQDMLDFAYHVRYELIEFAVFVLAARGLGLVPLHGACVGRHDRGILLLGGSGAGKSTTALFALLHGFGLLSEDAVFVQAEDMLATGIPNFLHVRVETLRFIDDCAIAAAIRQSPVIRRRSGIEKHEVNLSRQGFAVAAQPLKLAAAVILAADPTDEYGNPLRRLAADEARMRIRAEQSYAVEQPNWSCFERQLAQIPAYELRRGTHPKDSATALQTLI